MHLKELRYLKEYFLSIKVLTKRFNNLEEPSNDILVAKVFFLKQVEKTKQEEWKRKSNFFSQYTLHCVFLKFLFPLKLDTIFCSRLFMCVIKQQRMGKNYFEQESWYRDTRKFHYKFCAKLFFATRWNFVEWKINFYAIG